MSQAFQFSCRIGFGPRNTQNFTPVASPPKFANEIITRQIFKMAGEVKFIPRFHRTTAFFSSSSRNFVMTECASAPLADIRQREGQPPQSRNHQKDITEELRSMRFKRNKKRNQTFKAL